MQPGTGLYQKYHTAKENAARFLTLLKHFRVSNHVFPSELSHKQWRCRYGNTKVYDYLADKAEASEKEIKDRSFFYDTSGSFIDVNGEKMYKFAKSPAETASENRSQAKQMEKYFESHTRKKVEAT